MKLKDLEEFKFFKCRRSDTIERLGIHTNFNSIVFQKLKPLDRYSYQVLAVDYRNERIYRIKVGRTTEIIIDEYLHLSFTMIFKSIFDNSYDEIWRYRDRLSHYKNI